METQKWRRNWNCDFYFLKFVATSMWWAKKNQLFSIFFLCDTNEWIFTFLCFALFVMLSSFFFYLIPSITHMTDFSLTSFQSNYVFASTYKKNCTYMIEWYFLALFFHTLFDSLIQCDYLSLLSVFEHYLLNCHIKCSESEWDRDREREKTAVGAVHCFYFWSWLPLSVSFFIRGFVVFPPSLYDIYTYM